MQMKAGFRSQEHETAFREANQLMRRGVRLSVERGREHALRVRTRRSARAKGVAFGMPGLSGSPSNVLSRDVPAGPIMHCTRFRKLEKLSNVTTSVHLNISQPSCPLRVGSYCR